MSQPYEERATEWVNLESGQRLRVHSKEMCRGGNCSIHNPSDEAKAIGTRQWRSDRAMMERICSHGVGHPDPDELAFLRSIGMDKQADVNGLHGCDGCCSDERRK